MIDLHSHILPGLDDGPATMEGSLELARAAVGTGTRTILATPHINADASIDPPRIAAALVELRAALAQAEIPLEVLPGGEIAIWRLVDLDDDTLRALALGGGPYLLVESPLAPVIGDFEPMVLDLHGRGHRVLLAHPERCPAFQRDPSRLKALVGAGALVQLTAGAMTGGFGSTVRRFTIAILGEGLAHVVASDAHDAVRRPPGLQAGFPALEDELPGLSEHADWLTRLVPRAVLDGAPLPARPALPVPRPPGLLRRLGLRST
ncbi:MAG: CpsB/CapC family capsule biosynthesis tyrosine phosphatase [Solirubrobacteraceae bacterium]